MKKNHRVFVELCDMARNAETVFSATYADMTTKQALINAIQQYSGDYDFRTYPDTMPGIYESKVVRDRFYYDLTENLVFCTYA